MSKPTDQEFEDRLAEQIYNVLTGEQFHKFYMSKSVNSLTGHIQCDEGCPTKEEIKEFIIKTFDYDLNRTLDQIRPDYKFYVSCQKSVPEAIIAFLESTDFEDCIRKAISIGGDSDTIAAMAGGIAEAFYEEIPAEISAKVFEIITKDTEFLPILEQFYKTIQK